MNRQGVQERHGGRGLTPCPHGGHGRAHLLCGEGRTAVRSYIVQPHFRLVFLVLSAVPCTLLAATLRPRRVPRCQHHASASGSRACDREPDLDAYGRQGRAPAPCGQLPGRTVRPPASGRRTNSLIPPSGGEQPPARHPAKAGALPHGRSTWPRPGCTLRRSTPGSRRWPGRGLPLRGQRQHTTAPPLNCQGATSGALDLATEEEWRLRVGLLLGAAARRVRPTRQRPGSYLRRITRHLTGSDQDRARVTARSVHGTTSPPNPLSEAARGNQESYTLVCSPREREPG